MNISALVYALCLPLYLHTVLLFCIFAHASFALHQYVRTCQNVCRSLKESEALKKRDKCILLQGLVMQEQLLHYISICTHLLLLFLRWDIAKTAQYALLPLKKKNSFQLYCTFCTKRNVALYPDPINLCAYCVLCSNAFFAYSRIYVLKQREINEGRLQPVYLWFIF